MSPPKTPQTFLDRLRFDPAVLPILVAGIVLVAAVIWLVARPLPTPASSDPRIVDQMTALRAEMARLEGLTSRVATLEGRTGPDLAPLREALGTATGRAEALERRIAALEERAPPDLAPLREQIANATGRTTALDERLGALQRELANRPALDPNAVAQRATVEQLASRVEALQRELQSVQQAAQQTQQLGQRLTAAEQATQQAMQQDQQLGQRIAAAEQAMSGFAGRVVANESAIAARGQAADALGNRIAQLEQQLGARIGALDSQLAQRGQTIEQQAARIAAVESAAQRISALEGRSARLAALDAVRAALESGRPLGDALGQLQNPPQALTRFASATPPTEAQLRLSFEEAARAARAASEPPASSGVLDSAVSRLSGLITVRRGEETVWGDAASAELERARRAVEAGDFEGALRILQKLSPQAREAMRQWISQAEALVAARAAIHQMAAG
jgi:hypothetical protein